MKNFEIDTLVRGNIRRLTPYSTARDEFRGEAGVFLDANESPYENRFNRYPDPRQKELKEIIGNIKGADAECIFIGNGSDEAIDLIFRIFCKPGEDNAIAITPSYGMYKVAAAINDIELKEIPLNEDFTLNTERVLGNCNCNTKVIFLCSPNNPTGNSFPSSDILRIADEFNGILVIDEAYIDFSDKGSFIKEIGNYSNIIVLQTLSKAWGMAGLRVGVAIAQKRIIEYMNEVKYPYNINCATSQIAAELLSKGVKDEIEEIKRERERLVVELEKLDIVKMVYPSDANFLLVKFDDAERVYNHLLEDGIIVRNRDSVTGCKGCLRITVGLANENGRVLKSLRGFGMEKREREEITPVGRYAKIKRVTKETDIEVEIDLDGKGNSEIDTGLNFFNHMLNQIVHHGDVAMKIRCKGDLEVDEHHTIEDVAIVLGEAIYRALGSKRGIERYGFALPMDECKALVLLDFGGRADFVWDVNFTREMVGDVPTEMFKHFFKTLCIAMKCNLQIEAKGENNHHLIEGVFKAFARAIKMAIRRDIFKYELPSSKGVL